MPINPIPIPLFFDESSTSERINMTSVFKNEFSFWKKMQLTMHKAAPNIKSSVQKYQSSVLVPDVFLIAALIWVESKVLFSQKNYHS